MSTPEVSIVIISYGTRDLTLAALDSVRRAGEKVDLEAVVVDNASPDDSADAVAADHPWATLLRSDRNRGFAAAANQGARVARGRWLLFLNSDARLLEESLPRLLKAARDLDKPGALGPRLDGPGGPEPSIGHFLSFRRDLNHFLRLDRIFPGVPAFEGIFLRRLPQGRRKVEWITGACLLVSREVFTEVGGFDEAYFMYVEDMDLCYRLRREGRVNLFVPDAVVRHELGASPRDTKFLLEGGGGPEYFVRKFDLWYPRPLQRGRRVLGLSIRLASVSARRFGRRLRGLDTSGEDARAAIFRRSLGALLGRERRDAPPDQGGS